ncbi:response regulator [Clostridiaceae bacterium UIB06]|uniref:histidine kinase n=1 Tax=Clostridium thailandense TaxID=2794346 RepID=A0A949WQ83_9CLOT|nr:response regulator [Clostridium thailandense]MBV7272421.1 response regulator [Clostridium thailandense]MCH5136945.1 response regulator [Clostridiaceae bacterium UIB06]
MSTNDAEFLKRLRSTFNIEAHDHLKSIFLSLLELENKYNTEEQTAIIETIYREFHSLKGAARAVNLREIETICHKLESIFSSIKKGKLNLNTEMFDRFNDAVNTIEDILSLPDYEIKDISNIIENLEKIEHSEAENSSTEIIDRNKDKSRYFSIPKELNEKAIDKNIVISDNFNINNDIQVHKDKEIKILDDKNNKVIKVPKDKLDSLLIQGEELLYAKLSAFQRSKEIRNIKGLLDLWKKKNANEYIRELENSVDTLLKCAESDAKTIELMTDSFIEDIKDIMLLPFSYIIEMFPKMIRDLSKEIGKDIEFVVNGIEIEVDRRILEEIKHPLMHIIRNCIDHGIEKPEHRHGKQTKGKISLNITQISSDRVKIEISDDGAGIDINEIKMKAVKKKFLTEEEARNIDDEIAKMLIFKSSFSTSDIITDISGRGLGLAIVYEKVQKLRGFLDVVTERQKGTKFTIVLPITMSTNRGILIRISKQIFLIPTGNVEKVLRIKKDEIRVIENRPTILFNGLIIPIFNLKDALEIRDNSNEDSSKEEIILLIVGGIERSIAFSADDIIVEQEILVKRFNKQLKRVRNISGATILGSGQVVPILNVEDLIKTCVKIGNKSLDIIKDKNEDGGEKKSIIVVEDSITSRTLIKNILETQGYLVKTAVDGLQGWNLLKSERFDLVITDVEMPKMDGFQLTSKIRGDNETTEIPVILVTSLESREDKERGIDVGASAYIIKSDFQQSNLLEIVKRLI